MFENENLQRRGKDGKPDPVYRVPYHAVIHAPNEHNDARNYHLHVAFSEKPASRMIHPETGRECWDFEVALLETDKHRNTRLKRPFERPRNRDLNNKSWAGTARKLYARLTNEALAASNLPKRYDPRRYVDMGVETPARARLPKAVVAALKKGRAPTIQPASAKAIAAAWDAYEADIVRRHPRFGYSAAIDKRWHKELSKWYGDIGYVILAQNRHEWRTSATMHSAAGTFVALDQMIYDRIRSQIDPPLAPGDADAKAFLAAYDRHFMAPNREAIRLEAQATTSALRYLENAGRSDPARRVKAQETLRAATPPRKFGNSIFDKAPPHIRQRHEDYIATLNARFQSYVDLFYPAPKTFTPEEVAKASEQIKATMAKSAAPAQTPIDDMPPPLQGAPVQSRPVPAPEPVRQDAIAPAPAAKPQPAALSPMVRTVEPPAPQAAPAPAASPTPRPAHAPVPQVPRPVAEPPPKPPVQPLPSAPSATPGLPPLTGNRLIDAAIRDAPNVRARVAARQKAREEAEAAEARARAAQQPKPPEPQPPRKKKRRPTEAEIRQRAIIAARNRGWGR